MYIKDDSQPCGDRAIPIKFFISGSWLARYKVLKVSKNVGIFTVISTLDKVCSNLESLELNYTIALHLFI